MVFCSFSQGGQGRTDRSKGQGLLPNLLKWCSDLEGVFEGVLVGLCCGSMGDCQKYQSASVEMSYVPPHGHTRELMDADE